MSRRTLACRNAFVLSVFLALAARGARGSAPDLTTLRAAAERGEPGAALAYAKALPASARAEARTWARRAAEGGDAEAWLWLGSTASSDGEGLADYERAAELGNAEAISIVLDRIFFFPIDRTDVRDAKRFADLARGRGLVVPHHPAADLAVIDRCFEAGPPEVPAADLPTPGERAALANEDCGADESGAEDWVRIRKCLLTESPRDDMALAEIYANGRGVARNPRLAIAFVCHGSDVPAELIGMVSALDATRDEEQLTESFRFCDFVTSGEHAGLCAADAEAVRETARTEALAALTASWTEAQKSALSALEGAASAFFEAHSTLEVDLSGTARVAIASEEEGTLRDGFLADLTRFEQGDLPAPSDLGHLDRELNQVYAKLLRAPTADHFGTVDADGLRTTERAWLAYRDAWARLGVARYPQTSEERWKAWVTTSRVEQLRAIAEEW